MSCPRFKIKNEIIDLFLQKRYSYKKIIKILLFNIY